MTYRLAVVGGLVLLLVGFSMPIGGTERCLDFTRWPCLSSQEGLRLRFATDQNTDGSEGLILETWGIDRMHITPEGKVGIGLSTPDSLLDVQVPETEPIIARFGRLYEGEFQSLMEVRSVKTILSSGSELGRGTIRLMDAVASPNRTMELGYYQWGAGLFTENLFEFWSGGVSVASFSREPFLAVRDRTDVWDIRLRHDGHQGYLGTTGPTRTRIQVGGPGEDQAALATIFGQVLIATNEGNVGVRTSDDFGDGSGVIGIAEAAVVPETNPTGGGILYVEDGALKYRGPTGTVTTLAVP